MLQLYKTTPEEVLKNYFANVIALERSTNPFPVDLDDVWALIYPKKDHAIRILKGNSRYKEGHHYIIKEDAEFIFPKNGKNKLDAAIEGKTENRGRNPLKYFLTTSTLENLVLYRVPEVFEVYRKVFHLAAQKTEGVLLSAMATNEPILTKTTNVEEIAEYIGKVYKSSENGDKFPICLNSVFQLRLATLDEALNELKTEFHGYKNGEDYIVITEGEKIGYFLSINGFIKMMGNANLLVARAYEKAVDKGLITDMPAFLLPKKTVKDMAAAAKIMKSYGISGTLKEQTEEARDRLHALANQSEDPTLARMFNGLLSGMVEALNYLDNIQEEE